MACIWNFASVGRRARSGAVGMGWTLELFSCIAFLEDVKQAVVALEFSRCTKPIGIGTHCTGRSGRMVHRSAQRGAGSTAESSRDQVRFEDAVKQKRTPLF